MFLSLNESIARLLILDVEADVRRISCHGLSVVIELIRHSKLIGLHHAEASAHFERLRLSVEVFSYEFQSILELFDDF